MSIVDKKGSPFEVKNYKQDDYQYLLDMYDAFAPKGRFQGMPPINKNVRYKWIKGLTLAGENFLAWQEGKVIGHVVILPDFEKSDAEYLIFVSQVSRGLGVGKELTSSAIKKAGELGLRVVWLTVDSYNFRAINLYKKSGFQLRGECSSSSERVMFLDL